MKIQHFIEKEKGKFLMISMVKNIVGHSSLGFVQCSYESE